MALDPQITPDETTQEAPPQRRVSIQAAERRRIDRERRKRERGRFLTVAAVVAVVSLAIGIGLAQWLW